MDAQDSPRFRRLRGPAAVLARGLALAVCGLALAYVFDVTSYLRWTLYAEQYLAWILAVTLALAFLLVPHRRGALAGVPWFDWVAAVASLAVGGYVGARYEQVALRMGLADPGLAALSGAGVLLLLEAVRRLFGLGLLVPMVAFILYARFGSLMPGPLATRPASWERVVVQLFVGSDGVFGIALRTVALVVFAYVLFGKVFVSLGGGELLSSLAERVMGRYRGGPAKVAVISSAFFGMLSGSPVANVVGTGAFTIPLMKRVGYPADFAAGVEAVASTGGLLTPPVMGAAAFIMADFLGVGYSRVALAAVVPAVLYYLALLAQVDLRAARLGLRGLDVPRAPLGELARRSWPYLVSFGVLLAGLFYLFARPEKAALYAAAALVACAAAVPAMRARLSKALVWMEELGREVLDVILVAAAAGLIVGSVAFTGLGVTLSRVLVELAEGNVWALLAATALASIVLGMGLPVTVCYILLAVLAAPALVSAGIEPMAAHMFLLYYGAVSFITPPVCTAAYAAASIAGTSMVRVGLQAIKLGIVAYVVPFAFVLHPEMLTFQTWWRVLADVPLVAAGALLLAAGLEGHLLGRLGPARRAALIVLGTVALVHPALWVKLVAACLGAVAGALERRAGRPGWALFAPGKTAAGDG